MSKVTDLISKSWASKERVYRIFVSDKSPTLIREWINLALSAYVYRDMNGKSRIKTVEGKRYSSLSLELGHDEYLAYSVKPPVLCVRRILYCQSGLGESVTPSDGDTVAIRRQVFDSTRISLSKAEAEGIWKVFDRTHART